MKKEPRSELIIYDFAERIFIQKFALIIIACFCTKMLILELCARFSKEITSSLSCLANLLSSYFRIKRPSIPSHNVIKALDPHGSSKRFWMKRKEARKEKFSLHFSMCTALFFNVKPVRFDCFSTKSLSLLQKFSICVTRKLVSFAYNTSAFAKCWLHRCALRFGKIWDFYEACFQKYLSSAELQR